MRPGLVQPLGSEFAPVKQRRAFEDIIVQVGMTGALTPVALLKPVPLAATLKVASVFGQLVRLTGGLETTMF